MDESLFAGLFYFPAEGRLARHKRGNGNSPQGPSPTLPIPALASALGAVLDVQKELAEKDFAKDTIQVGKVDAVDSGVMYVSLVNNAVGSSSLPPYGDARRDVYLSDMWRKEPILAGTVDAMVLKAGAWDWTLTGGRNTVAKYHNILSMFDGEMAGWQAGVQRLVLSLMTLDRGAFNEVVRERGKPTGNVTGLATLDPLRCRPTSVSTRPSCRSRSTSFGGGAFRPSAGRSPRPRY